MIFQVKIMCETSGKVLLSISNAVKLITCHRYGTNVGNSLITNVNESAGLPERWLKFWFFNMKRKAELEGLDAPMPRANQQNWNYKAELLAFQ